jgi:DNA-binding CsgD family transcriptional regulator
VADRSSAQGAHVIGAAVRSMQANQGRARQFWRVFEQSRVPMVVVDNQRRYLAANVAARLVFRLSLQELQDLRIEDLTPPDELGVLNDRWGRLMSNGTVSGDYDVDFPDGSMLQIVYAALANILPGEHLIAFAPADWPGDELGASEAEGAGLHIGRLSPREREVLTLIASGAELGQIASELTISVSTVRTHLRNALRKLGARNRAHAIALALADGTIEVPRADPSDPPLAP